MNASSGISAAVVALVIIPSAGLCQTGTITGTVSVEGSVPAPRLIEIDKNREVCGDTIRASDIVVSDGKVAFAAVFVEGLKGEVESKEYLLSNTGCRFDPPVLAAAVGGTLVVDNRDEVLHNTHLNLMRGTRGRTIGNWALSRKGASIRAPRALRRPGVIEVECDAHSWMHAKIFVFDHPYFALTDGSGSFEITDVPVGTHTIKVSHEVFGELERSVTVREGAVTWVTFVLPAQER